MSIVISGSGIVCCPSKKPASVEISYITLLQSSWLFSIVNSGTYSLPPRPSSMKPQPPIPKSLMSAVTVPGLVVMEPPLFQSISEPSESARLTPLDVPYAILSHLGSDDVNPASSSNSIYICNFKPCS